MRERYTGRLCKVVSERFRDTEGLRRAQGRDVRASQAEPGVARQRGVAGKPSQAVPAWARTRQGEAAYCLCALIYKLVPSSLLLPGTSLHIILILLPLLLYISHCSGNSNGFRSSVSETRIKTKSLFLVINHNITVSLSPFYRWKKN